MQKTYIFDIETNGFKPSKIWVIGVLDYDTGDYEDFYEGHPEPDHGIANGVLKLLEADWLIGQNILGYDVPVIERLLGVKFDPTKLIDTLPASRLVFPEHGPHHHSLDAWGKRLGLEKIDFGDDFSKLTPEMLVYCRRDVELTYALYATIEQRVEDEKKNKGIDLTNALTLENRVHAIIAKQVANGFAFDKEGAEKLAAALRTEVSAFEDGLRLSFPPLVQWKGHRTVKSDKNPFYCRFASYDEIEFKTFNPGSREELAERLVSRYDWKPTTFTDKGSIQLNDEVLADLSYDEAILARNYFDKTKQLAQISDGNEAWLKYVDKDDGRVHGGVNPLGARTHRMAHYKPNVAQADKRPEMRRLWIVPPGKVLVGIDADSLEARCFAHYLFPFDGGAYARLVDKGQKRLGTDLHTSNQKAMGMFNRDNAKSVLYAFLYGAGLVKLGRLIYKDGLAARVDLGSDLESLGRAAKQKLGNNITGYHSLVDAVKRDCQRGYLIGLDGRKIEPSAEFKALNTVFQAAGAIVMKKALVILDDWITEFNLDALFVLNCHDEWEIETLPEIADLIGELGKKAIAQAGVDLGMKCPMTGNYKIGTDWSQVH